MITLKQWMECVHYRITEGSNYGWQCYGNNAYDLSCWDHDHDGVSSNVVFDTKTQEVYEVTVCDYKRQRAYRLINPYYRSQYNQEASTRQVEANQAWDDVDYTDLETYQDFLDKATAIMNYEEYDQRISVPIDLPDHEMFTLFKMAHEQDITLNQLVERMLRAQLDCQESVSDLIS
jgi:predicted HicB family RNase H-like nuclease